MAQEHERVNVNATCSGFDCLFSMWVDLICFRFGVEAKRLSFVCQSIRNGSSFPSVYPAKCGIQREADEKQHYIKY